MYFGGSAWPPDLKVSTGSANVTVQLHLLSRRVDGPADYCGVGRRLTHESHYGGSVFNLSPWASSGERGGRDALKKLRVPSGYCILDRLLEGP
jgi:hypothetical protein